MPRGPQPVFARVRRGGAARPWHAASGEPPGARGELDPAPPRRGTEPVGRESAPGRCARLGSPVSAAGAERTPGRSRLRREPPAKVSSDGPSPPTVATGSGVKPTSNLGWARNCLPNAITFLRAATGFRFLAVVREAWFRRIEGRASNHDLKIRVVLDALGMVIADRTPRERHPSFLQGVARHVLGLSASLLR